MSKLEQYLLTNRWKKDGDLWVSPYSQAKYDLNGALGVLYMLMGKAYIESKIYGEEMPKKVLTEITDASDE